MGTPPLPLARLRPAPTPNSLMQFYVAEQRRLDEYLHTHSFANTDWESVGPWIERLEALRRAAQSHADLMYQVGAERSGTSQRGVTTQEAAEALTSVFGGQSNRALLTLMQTLEHEVSPVIVDGIEPCGYEDL